MYMHSWTSQSQSKMWLCDRCKLLHFRNNIGVMHPRLKVLTLYTAFPTTVPPPLLYTPGIKSVSKLPQSTTHILINSSVDVFATFSVAGLAWFEYVNVRAQCAELKRAFRVERRLQCWLQLSDRFYRSLRVCQTSVIPRLHSDLLCRQHCLQWYNGSLITH